MHALRVIEGGKSNGAPFSGLEWESLKRELREIEVEIRNRPGDRGRELDKDIPFHMGRAKREKLTNLLTAYPWMPSREIADKLSVSERIIALTLKRSWAMGIYCRRGITRRGGVKYLWAVEGTPPY